MLPPKLVDRALAGYPLPIADAVSSLEAAASPHEERDRIIEVFRASIRFLGAIVLAARLQHGPGPGKESKDLPNLERSLSQRGLTDGQWYALVREILRPWAKAADAYVLPSLVRLIHGKGGFQGKVIDPLQQMRISESVPHSTTGDESDLTAIMERRIPQLTLLLEALEPVWAEGRLAVPIPSEPPAAWSLMRDTPSRERWRRIPLAKRAELGRPVLLNPDGRPILALHPIAVFRKPDDNAATALFLLDGTKKRKAKYVAIPSMDTWSDPDPSPKLREAIFGPESADPSTEQAEGRPFRGLSHFGPEHAELFFGRETESEQLANRIRQTALVTVTGPSGSGKSSLLQAGVAPLLDHLTTATLRPGGQPVLALEQCLSTAPNSNVLLLVDQAEELFTLCSDAADRTAFAKRLVDLAADPSFRVVILIRDDFFGRLAELETFGPLIERNVKVVRTPDRESMARALAYPVRPFGFRFEDDALVYAMVDEVLGEHAALPLLQFCADRMWDLRDREWSQLTRASYEGIGRVAGALTTHADAVIEALPPGSVPIARTLLTELVTLDRTRAVIPRDELVARGGTGAATVLDRLVDARLVTCRDDPAVGSVVAELAHEALLAHWARLDLWLVADDDGARLRESLRSAAREWAERDRPAGLLWRGEILQDLRAWIRRAKPILVGPEGDFVAETERFHDTQRFRRNAAVYGSVVFLSLVALLLGWQWLQAERARAGEAQTRIEMDVRRLVAAGEDSERSGRHAQALAQFRAADALTAGGRSQRLSDGLERMGLHDATEYVIDGHSGPVVSMDVLADTVATVTGSGDVRAWNLRTGSEQWRLPEQPDRAVAVRLLPDMAVTVARTGAVRIQRTPGGEVLLLVAADGENTDVAVDASENRVVVSSSTSIRTIDLDDLSIDPTPLPYADSVVALHRSDSGDGLAAALTDGGIEAWTAGTAGPLTLKDGRAKVNDVVFIERDERISPLHKPDDWGEVRPKLDALLADADFGEAEDEVPWVREMTWVETSAPAPLSNPERDQIRIEYERTLAALPTREGEAAANFYSALKVVDDTMGRLFNRSRRKGTSDAEDLKTRRARASRYDALARFAGSTNTATGMLLEIASDGPEPWRTHALRTLSNWFPRQIVVTADNAEQFIVWNLGTGDALRKVSGNGGDITLAVATPDGSRLATVAEASIAVWDLTTGRKLQQLIGATDTIATLRFHPSGEWLAAGTVSGDVLLWESCMSCALHTIAARRTNPTRTLRGHTGAVRHVNFDPDGNWLVSAGADGDLRMRDVGDLRFPPAYTQTDVIATSTGVTPAGIDNPSLEGGRQETWRALSPDGEFGAMPKGRKDLQLWAVDGQEDSYVTVPAPTGQATVEFSARGKWFAALDRGELKIWLTENGETRDGLPAAASAVSFSEDEERLAVIVEAGAQMWQLNDGTRLHDFGSAKGLQTVAWSIDGAVATGSADGTLRLHDPVSGAIEKEVAHFGDPVIAVAVAPGGVALAGVSSSGSAVLRRFEDERAIPLSGLRPADDVFLMFTPDGSLLLAGSSRDDNVGVWQVSTGQLIRRLGGLDGVAAWAFDPKMGKLSVISNDKILRSWSLARTEESWTNRRICRGSFEPVSIAPWPDPATMWASEAECAPDQSSGIGQ